MLLLRENLDLPAVKTRSGCHALSSTTSCPSIFHGTRPVAISGCRMKNDCELNRGAWADQDLVMADLAGRGMFEGQGVFVRASQNGKKTPRRYPPEGHRLPVLNPPNGGVRQRVAVFCSHGTRYRGRRVLSAHR